MKKIITILFLFMLISAALYYVPISFPPLNKVFIYALEKRFDTDLDCGSVRITLPRHLTAKNIKIAGKDGLALFIERGTFSYNLISLITTARLAVECDLSNVLVSGKASILGLVTDLLSMKSLEDIKFSQIKGKFFVGKESTIIQDLQATSEEIKFKVDGVTHKDNSINIRLHLWLNSSLSNAIPKEVRNALLTREEGPWSSLTIGLTGDYKKPDLRLLNKLFRLDIKTK